MPLPARLLLTALAGAAAAVAFPPYGVAALLPLGIAALALLLRGVGPRAGFGLGWVFGTAYMLVLLPWLQVIGVDAWILLSVVEGLFYGLLGLGAVGVLRFRSWPLWFAALWVAVDALRARVPFGGFPWGRLGFATVDTPVASLFPYVGPAGAAFAVALLGGVLAWAVLAVRRAPWTAVAGLVATCLAVSLAAVFPWSPQLSGDRVRVAAVQGNVPGEGMDAFAERRAVLDNHVHATKRLAAEIDAGRRPAPDLVVWPENSTDIDPFADPTVFADIQNAVDAVGVPVLVGAMVDGPGPREVRNMGIVWRPHLGPGQTYAKMHPVPFGEYIPLRGLVARFVTRLDQIPRDMTPGTRPGLLRVNGVPLGDVICFEVAYDGLLRTVVERGAGLLVVQTNNATYMDTGQVEQQFAIARLRAMETGRYVVVAATDGVSGLIGPDGSVVQRLPVKQQRVLDQRVTLSSALTPGVRLGGWVELGLAALGAAAALAGLVRRRGSGGGGRPGGRSGERRTAPEEAEEAEARQDPALVPGGEA